MGGTRPLSGGSSRIHGVVTGAVPRTQPPIWRPAMLAGARPGKLPETSHAMLLFATVAVLLASLAGCRAPGRRSGAGNRPDVSGSALPPPLYPDELLAPSIEPGDAGRRREMRQLNDWLSASTAPTRDAQRTSAWLRLAVLNARNGDPEEAEACLVAATSAPAHPRAKGLAWLLRARIDWDAGRRSDAIAALDKAERYATDPGTRRHVADARRSFGSPARAPAPVKTVEHKQPAIASELRFVRRSQWGSRTANRHRMDPMLPPKLITVHHSAMPPPATTSGAAAQVRQIQRNQMTHLGWGDIGYHFLIDRLGVVFEGRELRYQGAHAGDNISNRGNIGICLLGNFQPGTGEPSQEPTRAQVVSLERLVSALCARYGIPPSQIKTHREVHPKGPGATLCPGDRLVTVVRRMRTRLARSLGTND